MHATNEKTAEATGLAVDVGAPTMKRLNNAHFTEASDVTSQGDHHPVYIGVERCSKGDTPASGPGPLTSPRRSFSASRQRSRTRRILRN